MEVQNVFTKYPMHILTPFPAIQALLENFSFSDQDPEFSEPLPYSKFFEQLLN